MSVCMSSVIFDTGYMVGTNWMYIFLYFLQ